MFIRVHLWFTAFFGINARSPDRRIAAKRRLDLAKFDHARGRHMRAALHRSVQMAAVDPVQQNRDRQVAPLQGRALDRDVQQPVPLNQWIGNPNAVKLI